MKTTTQELACVEAADKAASLTSVAQPTQDVRFAVHFLITDVEYHKGQGQENSTLRRQKRVVTE